MIVAIFFLYRILSLRIRELSDSSLNRSCSWNIRLSATQILCDEEKKYYYSNTHRIENHVFVSAVLAGLTGYACACACVWLTRQRVSFYHVRVLKSGRDEKKWFFIRPRSRLLPDFREYLRLLALGEPVWMAYRCSHTLATAMRSNRRSVRWINMASMKAKKCANKVEELLFNSWQHRMIFSRLAAAERAVEHTAHGLRIIND